MHSSRFGLVPVVSALLMLGGSVNVLAQDRPLPAGGEPRQQRDRMVVPEPPPPAASPALDVVLRRASLTRAEVERRKRAARPGGALTPAKSDVRAEVLERSRRAMLRPPVPPQSPSTRELIEIIRRQPGGQKLLDRARSGGAKIVGEAPSNGDYGFASGPASGGPHVSEAVFTSSMPGSTAQAPLVVRVTRGAPNAAVAGLGSLNAQAYYPYTASTTATLWGPLDHYTYDAASSATGSTYAAKSYILFSVSVQTTGWYLINVVASPTGAQMRKRSSGYSLIQTFTNPGGGGYTSYPVLLNLASGTHSFSWVNLEYFVYVSEVSVTKL